MTSRNVYFLSNHTAITAETLGKSLLAQFPDVKFSVVTMPYIDSIQKAEDIVKRINQESSQAVLKPMIISTLANESISQIIHQSDALVLDLFQRILPDMERLLNQHSAHQTGLSHRISNQLSYESRIDAIDFSMIHDDGGTTRFYDKADIIIVGVSRSGKTPTCLYLALQFGLKAANYPITEEDMLSESLPKPIKAYQNKLFGLTTNAKRLFHIRQQRLPQSRYASMEQCHKEIQAVEKMFRQLNVPSLDTTTISIEEIATTIVELAGLKRKHKLLTR